MDISKIKASFEQGEVNVIIEIPMNSDPVKYEFDKESGAIIVDRFIQAAMFYPCNYGFIPHTIAGDGDPTDVLVITSYPILSGAVIRVKPVGVLLMEDDGGIDEKIIAVPTTKLDGSYIHINDINDVDTNLKKRIMHFFEHYKDLDSGKWVKIKGFENAAIANQLIQNSLDKNNNFVLKLI